MKKQLLILLLPALSLTVNAQTACFGAGTNYAMASAPGAVVSADFNNDGKKDLATANANGNNVAVRFGTGTGTFNAATNFAVGSSPALICSADFNGDGKPDLATGNQGSYNISVILNTGSGSFGTATNYTLGTFALPESITSADFNGDGKKDLAVGIAPFSGAGLVGIFLGTGTGTFGSLTTFTATSAAAPWGIAAADLNGDSKTDIVTANYGANTISALMGTGTGSFGAPTTFASGIQPISVAISDFNGDGKKDVATANYASSNDMSVFLGTGTGSFGAATNITVGTYISSICTADFNADGKADLAVTNGNVYVFLGNGSGAYTTPTTSVTGAAANSILAMDFNGDALPDLAACDPNTSNAAVYLNCTAVGIEGFSAENKISVYPNPANGSFTIETGVNEQQTVQMFDVSGKLVLSKTVLLDKAVIDASGLNEGVYTLRFVCEGITVNKKLVIVK